MMLNRDQKTPKPMSIFVLCGAFEDQKTKQGEGAGSEGRPTAGFFKTSPNDVQQRLKLNESAILQKRRRLFSSIGNLMPLRRQLFLKARPLHVSRLLQQRAGGGKGHRCFGGGVPD
jgi:hypothetical protein